MPSRLLAIHGQLARTEPSNSCSIAALLKSGCGDGGVTGAQAADTTFQLSCAAIGDADVGDVGDCEHPSANSNMSPPSVRVTTLLPVAREPAI